MNFFFFHYSLHLLKHLSAPQPSTHPSASTNISRLLIPHSPSRLLIPHSPSRLLIPHSPSRLLIPHSPSRLLIPHSPTYPFTPQHPLIHSLPNTHSSIHSPTPTHPFTTHSSIHHSTAIHSFMHVCMHPSFESRCSNGLYC